MGLTHLATTNRFETVLADTDQSRDLHFQFRYKIFCEETGFEQASAFADMKERDQHDSASVHFIVWDHLHQKIAGTMRLVDASETRLPIEDITSRCMQAPWGSRNRLIEFSRLCIDKRYMGIHRDNFFGVRKSPDGKNGDETPILFHQEDNEILPRMFHAMAGWSRKHGKVFCFFLATKALARVLQRQEVLLTAVGPSVSHRGERIPYVTNIPESHLVTKARNAVYRRLADTCESFVKASALPPFVSGAKVYPPAVASTSANDATAQGDFRLSPSTSEMVRLRHARG